MTEATRNIGFYSALLSAAEVIVFAGALVAGQWSATITVAYVAAFFLAPTFVAMIASIHYGAAPDKRIWTLLALAAAVIYAGMIATVYYTQLAVVRTNPLGLSPETIRLISFTPGSFLFSIDMLGYAFMSAATLAAAPALGNDGDEKWLRRLYVVNGLLLVPTLIFPLTLTAADTGSGSDIFGTAALIAWSAIFAPLALLTARRFRR